MIERIASFQEMLRLNTDKNFSPLEYIFYVVRVGNPTNDFLVALAEILRPAFVEIEGRILVPSVGAVEKYQKLRQEGHLPEKAQYWANLTLITELFENDVPQVKQFAEAVALCWNTALAEQGYPKGQKAQVIEDVREGETFVCLTTAP